MSLAALRRIFPALVPPDKKAEARVAIAQDVIKTLAVGRMKAEAGSYFVLDDRTRDADRSFEVAALSVRRKGKTKCRVCAIGAAAVCAVGLYDDAPELEELWGNTYHRASTSPGTMRNVLARWFTRKSLDLIESAFEMNSSSFYMGGSSYAARYKARVFGVRYSDDSERLEAIMQNIVDNKGTFRP